MKIKLFHRAMIFVILLVNFMMFLCKSFRDEPACYTRVAIGPGISGNLESQGILWHLKKIREKSGNFVKFEKVMEF